MLWTVKKAEYRACQMAMGAASKLMTWADPEAVDRPGAAEEIAEKLKEDGIGSVLLVADRGVVAAGLLEGVTAGLTEANIPFAVFSDIHPNPTIPDIEAGLDCFRKNKLEGIVAIGGGSSMDCAKMIAARSAVPGMGARELQGNFKITANKTQPMPPLYAVPTTAGTGSETTIVAVVTDPIPHEKFTVQDSILLPRRVFLDAKLTLTLPAKVTANAGMDALTHAVESYIGKHLGTPRTREQAAQAVGLIFQNLPAAFADGGNLEARKYMLTASFLAGQSFGRAAVGYAHAIAHAAGGVFNLPHGELTAIVLPSLLEWYGPAAQGRLAEMIGVSRPEEEAAENAGRFIQAVYQLRERVHVSTRLPHMTPEDLETVCTRAVHEGNPLYPVPRIMSLPECREFVSQLMKKEEG